MGHAGIVQRILENLSRAVLLLDSKLRLRYMNPAGEMLFAMSARQAVGEPVEKLLRRSRAVASNLQQALASSHPYTKRELRLALSDRVVTVDCTVTPLIEPNQERALLVELQQLDRHLRVTREETLLAQHGAMRALLRGLAHEIKNPLGGLRGAAQLLERELPDVALKEYTQVIIGEADRLQNLLDRMLGPHTVPRKRAVNVHEILERVRRLLLAESPHGLVITRDYDPSLPDLYADADQIHQAVLNIARNATQALGERGRIQMHTRARRQFTIGHTRHRLVAAIEIVDNGPGIPPRLLENIFVPMVTGRAEGTGLGLSIAQSLITQHSGLIECNSRPGRTKFSILLPLETSNG